MLDVLMVGIWYNDYVINGRVIARYPDDMDEDLENLVAAARSKARFVCFVLGEGRFFILYWGRGYLILAARRLEWIFRPLHAAVV